MKITEIAEKLGLSPTTVSRSLSGRGRISESTRQKVLSQAAKLGYVPNYHAQHLATGRSGVILLHAADVEVEFMLEMARGIHQALQAQGLGLVIDAAGMLGEENAVLDTWAKSRAVDGAIIITGAPSPTHLPALVSANIPLVTVGYPWVLDLARVGSVTWNLAAGAGQVAAHLFDLGHRRIGYIDIGHDDMLVDSFRTSLHELGLALPDNYIYTACDAQPEAGAAALRQLLSLPQPPTAVFARNDLLAVGALAQAYRQGLRVPHDLSIVGHDDLPLARYAIPPLTTVHVDCPKVGAAAAEILSGLMAKKNAAQRKIAPSQLVECVSLVIRESTAHVRK
jgi:DNA-binding LacI/PurR family transcriptional regulator